MIVETLIILVCFFFISSFCGWNMMLIIWMQDTKKRRTFFERYASALVWVFGGVTFFLIARIMNRVKEESVR